MSSPISGFTAIPNPQMLAFMPIQSYLMMFFAGAGWQIGKRKISAIPNDAFNRMSINDLLKTFTADLRQTLPTLTQSLQDVTPLVGVLVEQYGDFVKEAMRHLPTAVQNVIGETAFQADNLAGLKAYLDKNLPPIPSALAAGAIGASTGAPSEFRDTSGMTLAQHNANKVKAAAALVKAKANRPRAIQKFGSTIITPQVGRDTTKRAAGQSARMERKKLLKEISDKARNVKRFTNKPGISNKRTLAIQIRVLKTLQQKLVNLLARYRF